MWHSQQQQEQQNRMNLILCGRILNSHPSDPFLEAAIREQEPEIAHLTLTLKSSKGSGLGLPEVQVLTYLMHR